MIVSNKYVILISFLIYEGKSDVSENSKAANDKLVLKQVSKVESIDESMTTNFSAIHNSVKYPKLALNTIVECAEESPAKVIKVASKSPAKSSKNALFDAIRARRKSGNLPVSETIPPKSPAKKQTPQKSGSSICTPLRKAIEARRKSAGVSNEIAVVEKKATPKSSRKSLYVSAFSKSMKEIEARRKSYSAPVASLTSTENSELLMDIEVSAPVIQENTSSEPVVRPNRCSLLRQIEARRKSFSEPAKSPMKQVVAECVNNSLEISTPAKSRKSLGRKSVGRKSMGRKSLCASSVETEMDEEVVVIPQTPLTQYAISTEEIVAANCTQLSVDALAVKLESKVILKRLFLNMFFINILIFISIRVMSPMKLIKMQ